MRAARFVHEFLEIGAAVHPDKQALWVPDVWHVYGDLDTDANRLSRLFIRNGLKRGDRIGIFLENSREYVVTYYAILKAGGITVAMNTENTADDVAYIAGDCGLRFIVTNERLGSSLAGPTTGGPANGHREWPSPFDLFFIWTSRSPAATGRALIRTVSIPSAMSGEASDSPGIRMIDLDVASIVYTSGSTGKPRGAVLSHLNIVSNTRSIVDYLGLTGADRVMVVLPFYYIYGKSLLNTHFSVGGSVVIDNRFLYPNIVLQTMQKQSVTGFAGVPSTYNILLRRSNLKSMRFPDLRYVTQAGGAMAPAIQKEVAEAFSPARLFIMYGATEASARLSYLSPDDLPRKWGSIGKAIPNVDLFVADESGRPMPAGKEGEVVARGSNIMSGYWNHPEETAKVLKNGLYYTGDLGIMDEEGFLYIVGRSKDMIKIGGNRVSAKEIEDALYEHPGVIEAAVIGVPDDVLGEAPKAVLVVRDDYRNKIMEELPVFLQRHLAAYKIPKLYELRDALPKNESGKIQKLKLR